MKSRSCVCFGRESSYMEPPVPAPRAVGMDEEYTRPKGLERKNSKLQTHVEVLKCRFGKPAARGTEPDKTIGPSKNWTPIYYAVYHQREGALEHFLRLGCLPDDADGTGQPPLCIAVVKGYTGIAKILLEAGANVDATTAETGETALHIAIRSNRLDIIDMLLESGPELEAHTTDTHETPLHYAASKSGSLATVVNLIRLGARYDTPNSQGQTPAEAALLANNIRGAIAIINAARGKRNKLVKEKEMLLKHVERGQKRFSMGNELIADIFTAACDPDSTTLVEAIKRDDAGLVEMFLSDGADPDRRTVRGDVPIFVALECAGAAVVQVLVKHKADITVRDAKGLTVLQAAFEGSVAQDQEGITAVFDCLLAKKAPVAVTYADGKTLLHRAVSPGFAYTKLVHLLLNAGVRTNATDKDGNTALHLASHSKSCVELLLKKGANPHKKNLDGLTPLLYATSQHKKEQEPDLEALIRASDPRMMNADGQTALHLAAWNGLESTIRILLKTRADTSVVDSKKRTALLLAALAHQWHIVPLLTIPPSIHSWDEEGLTTLHHIAVSIPKDPSTWEDIAAAAVPFCERGVSRSMRDRSGATPLILAVKNLPEDGLPVLSVLLMPGADKRNSWNCVSHEDHLRRDALYYAARMRKDRFVEALLRRGASFTFEFWSSSKCGLNLAAPNDKRIAQLLAQYEWSRRAGEIRRRVAELDPETQAAPFETVFSVADLRKMLRMGLDADALPKTGLGASLLWALLRQIPLKPSLSLNYILEAAQLALEHSGDPNVTTARGGRHTPSPQASCQVLPLSIHTITFLLEEYPAVDADLITLLLTKGTKLSGPSPFYGGRYPLHSAVKANRIDLVDKFLLQRADANCVDQEGRTPLFMAAEKGFWEISDTLLRRGARVNLVDAQQNTVLHSAAISASTRIVAALLRAGAKASAKNKKGQTPLACVQDTLGAKEKAKTEGLLKDAEEKELRAEERMRRVSRTNAVPGTNMIEETKARQAKEAKERQRAIDEAKQNHHRIEEAKGKERRPQDEQEKRRAQTQQEQLRKQHEIPKSPPNAPSKQPDVSPPLPQLPTRKRSFFRGSSLFSVRSKATPPSQTTSSLASTPKLELNIRVDTPPSSKPLDLAPVPRPAVTHFVDTNEKRIASPRTDSALSSETEKPLPVLDRRKVALDGESEAYKRDSTADELADWLALTRVMDRL